MLGKGLLLNTNAHLDHLLDCLLPGLVMPYERVVTQSVFCPFYVHLLERVSGQLVGYNILWCNAEKPG